MWVCNDCAGDHGYKRTMFKSLGKCEICSQTRECNDIRPENEPPMDPKTFEEAVAFLEKETLTGLARNQEEHYVLLPETTDGDTLLMRHDHTDTVGVTGVALIRREDGVWQLCRVLSDRLMVPWVSALNFWSAYRELAVMLHMDGVVESEFTGDQIQSCTGTCAARLKALELYQFASGVVVDRSKEDDPEAMERAICALESVLESTRVVIPKQDRI